MELRRYKIPHHCIPLYLIYYTALLSSSRALNFYKNIGGNSTLTWVIRPQASLEFSFKTNSLEQTVHLLTAYEPGADEAQLSLDIENSILKLCYGGGCAYDDDVDKVTFGDKWNDMEWHKVQIRVTNNELLIDIDGLEAMLSVEKISRPKPVKLYFGGSPKDFDSGFTGCIENVSFPIGNRTLLNVGSRTVPERKCLDGRCFNRACNRRSQCSIDQPTHCKCKAFLTPTVNCKGTLTKHSYHLDENTVIRDKIDPPFQNSRMNTIELTFRTIEPHGILVYNSKLLIELVNGHLEIQWSMGADWVEMKVGPELHDGGWHAVSLKRYGQQVVLNIDQEYEVRKSFCYYPQSSQCNQIPQLVFIGGYAYPNNIKNSKTKMNFAGCLTQMYIYNEINRDASYNYMEHPSATSRSSAEGNPLKKCTMRKEKTLKVVKLISTKSESTKNPKVVVEPMSGMSQQSTKLTQNTVAWITAGICVGAIAIIFTLACGFHFMRKKYSGHFTAKSEMNNAYQFGAMQGKMLGDNKNKKGVVV